MSATYVDPVFVMTHPQDRTIRDYRSVVNAAGTAVIFERWGNAQPGKGRAPWWSPDGRWVVFESNRASPQGQYAIYLYDYGDQPQAGTQVTDPKWNMNHAKWYPNGFRRGPSGNKTLVVASYLPGSAGSPAWRYGIANLNVVVDRC